MIQELLKAPGRPCKASTPHHMAAFRGAASVGRGGSRMEQFAYPIARCMQWAGGLQLFCKAQNAEPDTSGAAEQLKRSDVPSSRPENRSVVTNRGGIIFPLRH